METKSFGIQSALMICDKIYKKSSGSSFLVTASTIPAI